MSEEKKDGNKKLIRIFLIAIPAVLLLIVLRFVWFYFKSDGLSGLSILPPLLMFGTFFFALLTSGFFAAWVYQDCKKRGDDGVLWAAIVFIVTPFIGLLLYFLRRSEIKQPCPSCEHRISLRVHYCENCGTKIENLEGSVMTKRTHHIGIIVSGIVCMILMLASLIGFVASAMTNGNINTSVEADERVWNTGTIAMNLETYIDGVWKLDFRRASNGFVKQVDMNIQNASSEVLHADVSCGRIPEDAALTLWLVQGEVTKSIDVTNLSEPLEIPLNEFENGRIYVRLEINDVEDVTSEIYIK